MTFQRIVFETQAQICVYLHLKNQIFAVSYQSTLKNINTHKGKSKIVFLSSGV
jgi:hypothetical protein